MHEPACHEPECDKRAEGVVRSPRDLRDAEEQHQKQRQCYSHAKKSHLLADNGEDEIGVLLREKREPLLRAEREALAEHSTGADRNLGLDHVISGRARISRRIEEDLEPVLLIRLELLPQYGCYDTRRDVHREQDDPLDQVRPVIENEREQYEEPRAPHSCAERKNETHDRTAEQQQQRPRNARPVKHSEKDSDEHDCRTEIGLKHDDRKWNQHDERRLPEVEQRFGRLLSRSERVCEHQNYSELGELRWLTDAHPSNGEPALARRRGSRSRSDRKRRCKQSR